MGRRPKSVRLEVEGETSRGGLTGAGEAVRVRLGGIERLGERGTEGERQRHRGTEGERQRDRGTEGERQRERGWGEGEGGIETFFLDTEFSSFSFNST